jgi:hypothetical protein
MGLNPNAPQFVPKSMENFYFHVTKEELLPSIIREGLQPKFGGSSGGMSELRLKAQACMEKLSLSFVEGSKNKVHLTQSWTAVERYAHHSLVLTRKLYPNRYASSSDTDTSYDAIPMGKLPVILRCHLWSDVSLDKDPDDKEGLTTTQGITPDLICIAVEPRVAEGTEFWLPLQYFDASRYRPAYPDKPTLPTQYSR